MIRIFLVSAIPSIRAGLRSLLLEADDCQIVGQAETLEEAVDQGVDLDIDVLLLDAGSSLDPGALASLVRDGPRAGVVILGPVPGDGRLLAILGGTAWAYLPREARAAQLVAAVRAVASSLVVVDPVVGGYLVDRAGATPEPIESGEELTVREREVLQLVAEGLANKMIASRLSISEHTVKFHVAAILAKLGAASRTEAVHLGARRGLVSL